MRVGSNLLPTLGSSQNQTISALIPALEAKKPDQTQKSDDSLDELGPAGTLVPLVSIHQKHEIRLVDKPNRDEPEDFQANKKALPEEVDDSTLERHDHLQVGISML